MNPYASELDQAWLRLWTHHSPTSRLTHYLKSYEEENITVFDRRSLRYVLEDAPLYFNVISELRMVSWDDYRLLAQIGCALAPIRGNNKRGRISTQLVGNTYPAFAATISLGKYWWGEDWSDPTEKDQWARLILFKRIANGPFVRWGNVFYEWLDVAINKEKNEHWARAAYIGVDTSRRQVRVLAEPGVKHQVLPNGDWIYHRRVSVPRWVTLSYEDHAQDWERRHKEPCPERTVHEHAERLLAITLSEWRSVDKAWQVHLEKDGIEMRICVPERSAVNFFKDRDAEEGARRRAIFHIVRAHQRILPNGRYTDVKEHYRGNRVFNWNGYDVLITVPGHHHTKLSTYQTDAWNSDFGIPNEEMLTMPKLGKAIREIVRGWRPSVLHRH